MAKRQLAVNARLVGLVVALSLSTLTGPAQAGLKEAMNKMFVSASTDAQAIQSQRLNGMYGGSMALRPMSAGINIVQFAGPRIDAGCGGIDMFFGSFSFINGAQFEQLIRSIAANAVGYAVKMAIQNMCNPCANLIDSLEAAMRELNSMAKNTCAIAGAMFGDKDSMRKISEAAGRVGTHLSTAVQASSDIFKAENWRLSLTPKEQSQGGGSATSATAKEAIKENNPLDGNVVFRAANDALDNGANTLRAFMSNKDVIRVVMGLYGVVIINPDRTVSAQCPKDAPPEKCSDDAQKYSPSIATWQYLMEPKRYQIDGVVVKDCLNSECTKIGSGNIPLASWGGVSEAVNIGLFGVPEGAHGAGATPDSIVGAYIHKVPPSNNSLNSHARTLVAMVPLPILNLMSKVQDIPGGPATLGNQLAAVLPEYFAYQIASEFQNIGANVFSGQTKVDMPALYADNLAQKGAELNFMRPDGMRLLQIMNESVNSVVKIRELTRSQIRATNAKK